MSLDADIFVPVPLRWRHVVAQDTFLALGGQMWHVRQAWPVKGQIEITAVSGQTKFARLVDPDDVIDVLIPALERDAVELTREQLGARLIARRTNIEDQG